MKSVSSELQQMDTKKIQREVIKDGSETCYIIGVGDGGTDEKTGGGSGGCIDKDAKHYIGSDEDGQD